MLKLLASAALVLLLASGPAFAQDTTSGTQTTTGTAKGKKDKSAKGAVNNTICPVSGQDINAMGHPYTVEHKGQKVTLCCEMCKDKFAADPDKMLEKAKASAKK